MASRGIALGRIIEWAKNADMEEVNYAMHRIGNIMQARASQVDRADSHGKVKRGRKVKAATPATNASSTSTTEYTGPGTVGMGPI